MIPKLLSPTTETDYHMAMVELVVCIDDGHAGFSSNKTRDFFGHYFIPADFSLMEEKAIITKFYNDSLARIDDIKIGDAITKVNGKDVGAIIKEKEKYINGSNISGKKHMAWKAIFNGSTDSVNIEYIRDNQSKAKSISRYLFKDFDFKRKESSPPSKILDGNIGYVNLGALNRKEIPEIMESLKKTKAIIFDIRNYPNRTIYPLSQYVCSKRNTFFKHTYPDLSYPGKFIWGNGVKSWASDELKYEGKIVLMVNEKTQSHAEFTAMCLQTGDNVTTIGSQTSGADGNVSVIEMVGGFKTMISGIGIFYPDGTETQRKGVKIDIVSKPTIQGIKEGRDEVLERAVDYVNN